MNKFALLALGATLCAAAPAHAQNVFTGPANGDYYTAANWSQGHIPQAGELAIVNGNRTVNITTAAPGNYGQVPLFVGQNSVSTTTLNISGNGNLTAGNTTISLGRDSGATGILNQTGGTVLVTGADTGSGVGNFIIGDGQGSPATNSPGQYVMTGGTMTTGGVVVGLYGTGTFNVSGTASVSTGGFKIASVVANSPGLSTASITGGSVSTGFMNIGTTGNSANAKLTVGGSGMLTFGVGGGAGNVASVYGELDVNGSGATISTTSNADAAFSLRTGSNLRFNLGSNGASTINLANAKLGLATGVTLTIDGSAFTLGTGTYQYTLISDNGYSTAAGFGQTSTAVTYTGFAAGRTPTVTFGANAVTLTITVVPEPGVTALLGVAGVLVLVVSRKKLARIS